MQCRVKESKCANVCVKRSHSDDSSCVLSVDIVSGVSPKILFNLEKKILTYNTMGV